MALEGCTTRVVSAFVPQQCRNHKVLLVVPAAGQYIHTLHVYWGNTAMLLMYMYLVSKGHQRSVMTLITSRLAVALASSPRVSSEREC